MSKIIVVVAEGCPHCKILVNKAKIMFGDIEVRDVTKDDFAVELVMKSGMLSVPLIFRIDDEKACLLNDDFSIDKCFKIKEK